MAAFFRKRADQKFSGANGSGDQVQLEKIHNTKKRMPVILSKENERMWLQSGISEDTVKSMFQPYDAGLMEAYPVVNTVNKLGYNIQDREVLNGYTYPELPKL